MAGLVQVHNGGFSVQPLGSWSYHLRIILIFIFIFQIFIPKVKIAVLWMFSFSVKTMCAKASVCLREGGLKRHLAKCQLKMFPCRACLISVRGARISIQELLKLTTPLPHYFNFWHFSHFNVQLHPSPGDQPSPPQILWQKISPFTSHQPVNDHFYRNPLHRLSLAQSPTWLIVDPTSISILKICDHRNVLGHCSSPYYDDQIVKTTTKSPQKIRWTCTKRLLFWSIITLSSLCC